MQNWQKEWEECSKAEITKKFFPKIQDRHSRAVTSILTGHNTLRRHLYVMGLSSNSTCRRKCGTEEENSVHILCECEALASLRRSCLGSFFLNSEEILNLSIGAIWNCGKGTGLSDRSWGTKGLFEGLSASGPEGLQPKYYSFFNMGTISHLPSRRTAPMLRSTVGVNCVDYSCHFPLRQLHVFLNKLTLIIVCTLSNGARRGVVVKALRYKPAGRGFDSRWCHWNFSVT